MVNENKNIGFAAYLGQVNITLFNDIVEFIIGSAFNGSSLPVLRHLKENHIWFKQTDDDNIRQRYGFRYLGELLERYEKRYGSDIADIRAIALAMAWSKDMLTDDMFVGSQRDGFMRKISRLAEGGILATPIEDLKPSSQMSLEMSLLGCQGLTSTSAEIQANTQSPNQTHVLKRETTMGRDIYLTGALYLLGKGETDVRELLDHLTRSIYTKTEELLFVMSLYDRFEEAFDIFKPQLIRLIGAARSFGISASTPKTTDHNIGIFCWLIKRLRKGSWFKEVRTKDIAVLRAISELATTFVKPNNRHHAVLLANGYTANDILYLNSTIIRHRPTSDTMFLENIVAHKIAAEVCETFINSNDAHPADIYEHLAWVLERYDKFTVKIGGSEGIRQAIRYSIKLRNPQTFLWLAKLVCPKGFKSNSYERNNKISDDVFVFDIMDEKWDVLSRELKPQCYLYIFDNHLKGMGGYTNNDTTKEQILERLEKYNALTGSSYLTRFEDKQDKHYNGDGSRMFALMIQKGVIDLISAFDSCAGIDEFLECTLTSNAEGKKDKPAMMQYVLEYVSGARDRESFEFLRHLHSRHSLNEVRKMVESNYYNKHDHFFVDPFYKALSRHNNNKGFSIKRPFLTDEEHRELLGWLDDFMFAFRTKGYPGFVATMLLDDFVSSILPHDEMVSTYHMVKDLELEALHCKHNVRMLKEKFLSEAELQAERDAKKAREDEEKQIAREKELQELRDSMISDYDGSIRSIHKFMNSSKFSYRMRSDVFALTLEYTYICLNEKGYILDNEDINCFLNIGAKLCSNDMMTFEDFRSHVLLVERAVQVEENNDNQEDD